MQTNSNDELSVPTEKANPEREIHIVMMPVKEIGATRKFIVKTLKNTLGSIAALGWSMHWAISAENACFELERFPTRPYTRLKASIWDGSRNVDIIHQMYIGRSSWTNAEIEDIGTKYFQRNINIPYDLYINNCQTFVNHIAYQICSNKPPEDRLISIPLFHVLSMSAGRLYTALGVPFLRLWFRLSGCNSVTLTEFERVSAFWGYWLLPTTLHSCGTSFPIVIAEINKSLEEDPEKKFPESMRYVVAVMTSFWLFGFPIMQPLIILLASFPRAKRYPDGKWRLRYRPRRVPLMEVNGLMKIEDLRQEETVPPDGQDIIDEDGRFPDPDKLLIPTWLWVVPCILGFFLAVLYWSCRLTRYSLSPLKHKLGFNSK